MKERRGLGHDDEINLQAAIAKGLALLLQRMPRIAALRRQERYYDCVDANALSIRNRHAQRVYKGISDEAIAKMGSIVSEGVLRGQSPHRIFESDASLKAICCERTAGSRAGRVVAIAQSSNNAGGKSSPITNQSD